MVTFFNFLTPVAIAYDKKKDFTILQHGVKTNRSRK